MGYSKKGIERRRKSREGLSEFFSICVKYIIDNRLKCSECGECLKGRVDEVAHILPKGYFKSIQTHPMNWIPLCGMYSHKQCHSNFDNHSVEYVKGMNIYSVVKERFILLENEITEKIPYKIYEKYED